MNLKQTLKKLKDFYKSHAMIHTVKSGNQFNFNALSNIVYPIAHVEYIRRTTLNGFRTFSFLVTIADIFDPNLEESEEDIYSDAEDIANDTTAYFANLDLGLTVTENVQVEKFNNGLKDKVCGGTFIFNIGEYETESDCDIPFVDSPANIPYPNFVITNQFNEPIQVREDDIYNQPIEERFVQPGESTTTHATADDARRLFVQVPAGSSLLIIGSLTNPFDSDGNYISILGDSTNWSQYIASFGSNQMIFKQSLL